MKQKGKIIIGIAALIVIMAGAVLVCHTLSKGDSWDASPAKEAQKAEYHKITAEEAHAMMGDGQPFLLLDVRTPEEFAAEYIEGALLFPDNEIAGSVEITLPDKQARILVYCRSGRRSALAAKTMASLGYSDVYDFGGIIDWPYETVSD